MKLLTLLALATLLALSVLTTHSFAAEKPTAAPSAKLLNEADAKNIDDVLEPIRSKFNVPALAAAAVTNDRIVNLGAVGLRRSDKKDTVGINDCFHIGSCTKAMTATLCAILIQRGKLKWDSTIGEVFADQRDKIRPEYHKVTLDELLNHRSGLPEDRQPDPVTWPLIRFMTGPMKQQRRRFVEIVLGQKPSAAPGEKFQYSNAGYTLAGAMCERVTGKTWEELMRDELFKPLGMTTAGFGPPGSKQKLDQPCGHIKSGDKWAPMLPDAFADNPLVIGPAGTVHCSLADWAKFAAFHVRGEAGKEPMLPADVFRKLHTPTGGDYAYGWLVTKRGWAGGTALTHSGSNTMWMAVVWLAPKKQSAYLAATNCAGKESFEACDTAISKLIELAGAKN